MAYRKTYASRSYQSKPRSTNWDAVPQWRQQNTETCNLIFKDWMGRIGVTDIRSYFERLAIPVILCVVSGAAIGAYRDGWSGMLWYALAGVAAPAGIIWLCIVVGYAVILALAYVAVWTALIYGVLWIMSH